MIFALIHVFSKFFVFRRMYDIYSFDIKYFSLVCLIIKSQMFFIMSMSFRMRLKISKILSYKTNLHSFRFFRFFRFSTFVCCFFRLNHIAMQKKMNSMFIYFDAKFWRLCIFQFFVFQTSFLRYLQSKLKSHEKLNRVKNIFRNCCSILLNWKDNWKDRKIDDREIFNSKT